MTKDIFSSRFGKGAQPRLSVISSNDQNLASGTVTIATAGNYNTVRKKRKNKTGKTVVGVRYMFANAGIGGNGANVAERAFLNAIVVKTATEFEGTKANQTKPRTPGYFGGSQTAQLNVSSPGNSAVVVTDTMDGIIPPDGEFYERTAATVVTNGHSIPRGGCLLGGTTGQGMDTGDGWQNNSASERVFDGFDVGIDASINGYYASVVLGYLIDGTVAKSIAICGDSIPTGSDDAAWSQYVGGWAVRAFDNFPNGLFSFSGEQLQNAVIRSNFYTRWKMTAPFTHVLFAYGRNDIGLGARTGAQIKADILTAAYQFMMRGQHFIYATILPAPTSTDGFKTMGLQTPDLSADRIAVNQWLRDTSGAGFAAQAKAQVADNQFAGGASILDVCAPIETNGAGALTMNGGYIIADGTVYDTGTATSAATAILNDTGKAWAVNQWKGKIVHLTTGTGAGQTRCVGWNTATQLNVVTPFSPTPDATSGYEMLDNDAQTGVHPPTKTHIRIAASFDPVEVMNRL